MSWEPMDRSRLRSRQQVIVDILEAARQGAERRRIVKEAKVNYRQFSNIINALLAKDLVAVTESPDGRLIFKATSKGNRYVETYRSMIGSAARILEGSSLQNSSCTGFEDMPEKNEILEYVKNLKAADHIMLFYTHSRDRYEVLFTYFMAGLERGEAAAYVTWETSPEKVKQSMREFGINVEGYERNGALKIFDYKDWYIIDGKFDMSKTVGLWKKQFDEATARGFKGLRVVGEVGCFFENRLVRELLEYERALNKALKVPLTAVCAYDLNLFPHTEVGLKLLLDLANAHSKAITSGPKARTGYVV